MASCCHQCPLEVCIFDVPLVVQLREQRAKQIKTYRTMGFSDQEISSILKISIRTLQRVKGCDTPT